jgi:hypothetical protein
MSVRTISTPAGTLAEAVDAGVIISSAQDALDLVASAAADAVILFSHQLDPQFFDLRTGLAGDILQKFANYNLRAAIVGDFSALRSKNMIAFMRECNRTGQFLFVPTVEEARARLSRL